MIEHIYFDKPFNIIKNLFLCENIIVSEKFINNLINMLPGFLHYEEESQKIKPSILLCNSTDGLKKINGICYREVAEFDYKEFEKRLKAFLTFCINEFTIVFTLKDDRIVCGLVSYIPSDGQKFDDKINCLTEFMWISVLNATTIKILSSDNNILHIDFSFGRMSTDFNDSLGLLADTLSQHNLTETMQYKNILLDTLSGVHGTIIAVVSHKAKISYLKEDFDDGIWLCSPIKLSDNSSVGLKQILLSMFNCDGITIMNDNGEILAFNVFITSDTKTEQPGGARKRAFYTLTKNNKVIVVYFQSQDGNNDCRRGGYHE